MTDSFRRVENCENVEVPSQTEITNTGHDHGISPVTTTLI